MSFHRVSWAALPADVRSSVEERLQAPVRSATTASGGFGHQLASVLTLPGGQSVFIKAIPRTDPLAVDLVIEAAALTALAGTTLAPRLRHKFEVSGWIVLLIEFVPGIHLDLSPGSTGVTALLTALEDLVARSAAAAFASAASTAAATMGWMQGWKRLASSPPPDLDPWARDHLEHLCALEAAWLLHAAGDRAVHGDLRSDNMLQSPDGRVVLIDWAHACAGPACMDLASLAPQLVRAGWDPIEVVALLNNHPATRGEQPAVWALLAALTGYWEHASRQPEPPRACGLRTYQQSAAAAGRALLASHPSLCDRGAS